MDIRLESRNWHLRGQFPWDSLVKKLAFRWQRKQKICLGQTLKFLELLALEGKFCVYCPFVNIWLAVMP